jgi:hypothetical protein
MYKVMRMELQESSREEESAGVQESAWVPPGVQERGERGEEKSESELERRRRSRAGVQEERGGWYIVEPSIYPRTKPLYIALTKPDMQEERGVWYIVELTIYPRTKPLYIALTKPDMQEERGVWYIFEPYI